MQLNIADIKQFIYCPRVIYYTYVEPVPKKVSFKMKYARKQHNELNQKEKRRGLKRYNLIDGDREFGTLVHSKELNFYGKLDILIDTHYENGQRFYPVECKDTDQKIHNNIKYQLVAYAMCLEEMTGTPVNQGYIYIIPEEKAYPIEITDEHRAYIRKMITMIHKIVHEEHYPEPRSRKRCWDCEFARYCNDFDISSREEIKERNKQMVFELFGNLESNNNQ